MKGWTEGREDKMLERQMNDWLAGGVWVEQWPTWAPLLVAGLHLLAVPWARLPPKKGPHANALPPLCAPATRPGARVPGAPELPQPIHGALAQVAVSRFQPLSPALGAAVRGAAALPDALLGAVGTGHRTRAPARPFVPHPIHWGAEWAEGAQNIRRWGCS